MMPGPVSKTRASIFFTWLWVCWNGTKPIAANLFAALPALLHRVEIIRSDVRERFKLRYTEEDLGHNLSLENKLKADFGLTLPHLPELEELELEPYFSQVERAVAGLRRWRVERQAISLGFFSFAKQVLYKDLEPEGLARPAKPPRPPHPERPLYGRPGRTSQPHTGRPIARPLFDPG